MLSTIDNPVNPFSDYEKWRSFDTDIRHPYNCEQVLAIFANVNIDDPPEVQARDIREGIESLLKLWPNGPYIMVDEDYIPKPDPSRSYCDPVRR